MPAWVVSKLIDALNSHGKALNGSNVLILGIAYKPNVDDMRESPSTRLMELLQEKGAEISYSDPYVPVFPKIRKYNFKLASVELTEQNIRKFDCILLATNHQDFDYHLIQKHAKLIVDTRGVYKENHMNVVRA